MNKIGIQTKPSYAPTKATASTKESAPLKQVSNQTRQLESNKYSYLGSMLSYLTLPSLRRELPSKGEIAKYVKDAGAEAVTINGIGKTALGNQIKLSGYLIENERPTTKWIVYFLPNDGLAENSLALAKNLSDELNTNVLVFNYRGVGNSTGHPSTANDLADDGAACFEYLNEMGVQYSDICAYGHSIGGGVAAQLLSRPLYSSAKLIADRTFTTLRAAIEAHFTKSVGQIIASWAKSFFEWSGWKLNTVENIQKIKGKVLITSTEEKYDYMVGKCQLADATINLRYTPYRLEPKRKDPRFTPDLHSLNIIGPKSHFANTEHISIIFRAHIK